MGFEIFRIFAQHKNNIEQLPDIEENPELSWVAIVS